MRQLVGYRRSKSREAVGLLEAICAGWRLVVNDFQLVRELLSKERVGSKVRRKYDPAWTPYRRVLTAPDVPEGKKIEANLRALARLPRSHVF